MSGFNCCFWPTNRFLRRQLKWSGIPISLRIFQFVVIHTVKGFSIGNEADIDFFLESACFLHDPVDVGNLLSGSSSWITAPLWWRDLYNSVKLWTMLCGATQDRWAIVKSSDKTWSTSGGNENPLQHSSCKNPINSMKRQRNMTLEDEPLMSEGVQYATGEWQRAITNSSRKNEGAGPKQKWHSVMDGSGGESKVCKML